MSDVLPVTNQRCISTKSTSKHQDNTHSLYHFLIISWLLRDVLLLLIYRSTHTHPFNGPFSGTTRVSRYQKGKTNLDFTEAKRQ